MIAVRHGLLITMAVMSASAKTFTPKIPKVWDDVALKKWATPVAGLNMRPTHMTPQEYYALPVRDFDPGRLKDSHVPGGFIPVGMKTNAIKGHEFGLKLDAAEREQLIAFLRTL